MAKILPFTLSAPEPKPLPLLAGDLVVPDEGVYDTSKTQFHFGWLAFLRSFLRGPAHHAPLWVLRRFMRRDGPERRRLLRWVLIVVANPRLYPLALLLATEYVWVV